MEGNFKGVKGWFSSVNGPLLKLKLCFFFVYSVWFSQQPFIAIIPSHIITFEHLAILYAIVPIFSIISPMLVGFLADKIGNYKTLIACGLLMGGTVPFGLLWLYTEHRNNEMAMNNGTVAMNVTDEGEELVVETGPSYMFPLLIFFRTMCFLTYDSTNTLLDACGLSMCKQYDGDFAKQKLWAAASTIIAPFIAGGLVDLVSDYLGYTDYSIAFFFGAAIMLVVIPLILKLDVKVEKNSQSMIATAKKVARMIDLDVFILVEAVVGMLFGFHMNFRPVFIHSENIGTKTLMGLCLTAYGIGTVLILTFAKTIVIEKLGEPNTVIIGLFLYCIRFIGYYFLTNPWILLVSEFFEGFSGFLSVTAGSYYCASAAPPGMLASLNGILTGAVFGLGRGFGTAMGSVLTHKYGLRIAYMIGGCLAGVTAIVYLILYRLFLKKIREDRMAVKSHSKEVFGVENPAAELQEDSSISKMN